MAHGRRFGIPLVAITAKSGSALASAANSVLLLPDANEACPMGLAPTTSTTMQMALGDALAVALLTRRGFTAADFRQVHPGGRLGARLRRVRELMHTDDAVPLVSPDTCMDRALLVMTEKRFGCLGVVDESGVLYGIVTDGDLRRHMGPDLLSRTVRDVMTANPPHHRARCARGRRAAADECAGSANHCTLRRGPGTPRPWYPARA